MQLDNIVRFKTIYFDLDTKKLKTHCNEACPNIAYYYIYKFMRRHGFAHAQGSGYHSVYKTTDLKVMELVENMLKSLPWFRHCVKKFETANLGNDSNLMDAISNMKKHVTIEAKGD